MGDGLLRPPVPQLQSWPTHKALCKEARKLREANAQDGSELRLYDPEYAALRNNGRRTALPCSLERAIRETLAEQGYALLDHHTNPDVCMEAAWAGRARLRRNKRYGRIPCAARARGGAR